MLGGQLLAGVFEHVLGFGGEAHDNLRPLAQGNFFQDVRRGFEFERHWTFALYLLSSSYLRTIVGNRRSLDDDGGLGQQFEHRIAHFFCGLDTSDFGCPRRRKGCRSTHQQHTRTTSRRGLSQGITHAPAGTVAEIANRIDLFTCRAGGDQNRLAVQVLGHAKRLQHHGNDSFVFGQPPGACHPARQIARARFDDLHTALAKDFQIRQRGRVIPHVDVHGGGNHYGRGGREIERSQEVVRNALREVRHYISRGGRYEQRVDGLRHRDVLDGGVDVRLVLFIGGEHPGDHFFTRERRKGERTNKFLSRVGHHYLHPNSAVLQQADNFRRLVGRDSAGHAQSNFHNG